MGFCPFPSCPKLDQGYNTRVVVTNSFMLNGIPRPLQFMEVLKVYGSKTCVKQPLKKRQNIDLNDNW